MDKNINTPFVSSESQEAEILSNLYESHFQEHPQTIERMDGGGSNRHYYRLKGVRQVIGVVGTSEKENNAFISISQKLSSSGVAVPQVYTVTDDMLCYLQEDLGAQDLYTLIKRCQSNNEWNSEVCSLLSKTMSGLVQMQIEGADVIDWDVCYPQPMFDRRTVMWDLNYFKYSFLKPSGIEFDEGLLENDFETLCHLLLSEEGTGLLDLAHRGWGFMHRDFQSRNVMLRSSEEGILEPCFIDFQGGRMGPLHYDVASFIWQARASYPEHIKQMMLEAYLTALSARVQVDKVSFKMRLMDFVLFRSLQVLGAYGFRGCVERKALFLDSISKALVQLKGILSDNDFSSYPYLVQLLNQLCDSPRFNSLKPSKDGKLEVKVMSFSYKKGIPEDHSGNGGGFIFDCRATHNPGRYEPYKKLTGLDQEVIQFLEDDGEILSFLSHVYDIIHPVVDRYLERGFTSLMVCFGCTGGQHRSVYSAQHLAQHLAEKYGNKLRVNLEHREQHIKTTYE